MVAMVTLTQYRAGKSFPDAKNSQNDGKLQQSFIAKLAQGSPFNLTVTMASLSRSRMEVQNPIDCLLRKN
jgi:hypothetical protein